MNLIDEYEKLTNQKKWEEAIPVIKK